ncbi:LuxR C-terminal-related transcriptional regulator [Streptomyces sp. NPDC101132]|uniref:helix-turn-helix transcriptional regulator n=1 Tax=Streptomyces sp. NPDC101132 TaxID=3366110 RepID=UPI003806E8C6
MTPSRPDGHDRLPIEPVPVYVGPVSGYTTPGYARPVRVPPVLLPPVPADAPHTAPGTGAHAAAHPAPVRDRPGTGQPGRAGRGPRAAGHRPAAGREPVDDPLLTAKLTVPAHPGGLVSRRRLHDALTEGTRGPLTVVTGPAGAGKTALAASWALSGEPPGPVAWVSLDACDRPGTLWAYVLGALRRAGVALRPDIGGPLSAEGVDHSLLVRLAASFDGQPAPAVLVLDGIDRPAAPDLAEGLRFLVEHSGPDLRLVLIGRAPPPLPLARYRAERRVHEIPGRDLAFTPAEAMELLATRTPGQQAEPAEPHRQPPLTPSREATPAPGQNPNPHPEPDRGSRPGADRRAGPGADWEPGRKPGREASLTPGREADLNPDPGAGAKPGRGIDLERGREANPQLEPEPGREAGLRPGLQAGRGMGPEQVREAAREVAVALVRRTEGWAAGLRLCALAMAGYDDAAAFTASHRAAEHAVADYLLAEVLDAQPEATRELLLCTGIFGQVHPDLADLLTRRRDSARVLDALARAHAFVEPIGDTGWYRFHPLFAGVLRTRLRDSRPDALPDLYRRAAGWLAGRGRVTEALEHAVAAGDWPAAASLAVRGLLVGRLLEPDATDSPADLFAAMPADTEGTAAALVAAARSLGAGDRAGCRAWLARAEARPGDPADAEPATRLTLALLRLLSDPPETADQNPAAPYGIPPRPLTERPAGAADATSPHPQTAHPAGDRYDAPPDPVTNHRAGSAHGTSPYPLAEHPAGSAHGTSPDPLTEHPAGSAHGSALDPLTEYPAGSADENFPDLRTDYPAAAGYGTSSDPRTADPVGARYGIPPDPLAGHRGGAPYGLPPDSLIEHRAGASYENSPDPHTERSVGALYGISADPLTEHRAGAAFGIPPDSLTERPAGSAYGKSLHPETGYPLGERYGIPLDPLTEYLAGAGAGDGNSPDPHIEHHAADPYGNSPDHRTEHPAADPDGIPRDVLAEHPEVRALLAYGAARARFWADGPQAARPALEEAVRACSGGAAHGVRHRALGLLALVEAAAGALTAAHEHAGLSVDVPRDLRSGAGHLALAAVAVERSQLRSAEEHLARADALPDTHTDPLLAAERALVAAAVDVAGSRWRSAAAALEAPCPDAPTWLAARRSAARTALALAQGDPAAERATLPSEPVAGSGPATAEEPGPAEGPRPGGSAAGVRTSADRPPSPQPPPTPPSLPSPPTYPSPPSAAAAAENGARPNPGPAAGGGADAAASGRPAPGRRAAAPQPAPPQPAPPQPAPPQPAPRHPGPPRPAPRRPDPSASVAGSGRAPVWPVLVEELSARERQVLAHVARLMSTDEIAAELGLSVNTVKTHLRSIFHKLGVSRRRDAVERARELRIL